MFDGQPKEILYYATSDGVHTLEAWLDNLRDRQARARINIRITRLESGNPGNYKSLGEGVYELKIDFGPGYRVYFGFAGEQIVLLLCGGDKSTQQSDIATAKSYWADYQRRSEL